MLITPNSYLFVYVIARDFGFAPNPFFGSCSLATCKPNIRKGAKNGDWILGVAGKGVGKDIYRKCILLMKVTEKMSFEDYWNDQRFAFKKPCRNGSLQTMLGDNIYHKDSDGNWIQENSHHSDSDGSINSVNLDRDTGTCDQVLISDYFFYFGDKAISIDLDSIDYRSGLGHKKIELDKSPEGKTLIELVFLENKGDLNYVVSDPCQFMESHKRVDQGTSEIF